MAGIYVHVPFCHAKCAYCDFYSIADRRRSSEYVSAVLEEFSERKGEIDGHPLKTLYFGGGTPSVLSEKEFTRLASVLLSKSVEEFTIEVNPEDVTPEKISIWLDMGVNRVSMGVQSLVDVELKAVNRRHTAAQAIKALKMLKESGLNNISCDLIYGLPGQTIESWNYSLRELLSQGITHLSAYSLTFEEGTLLWRRKQQGLIKETDDDVVVQMYGNLCRVASDMGFEHYEISNFALPGFYSRHNSSYWDNTPYLGLGPGAHSLDTHGIRRFNPSDLKSYITNPRRVSIIDKENDNDRVNDRIFTALRTARGMLRSDVPVKSHRTVNDFIKRGLMREEQGRVFIPEENFLISDSIIREIFV